MLSDNSESSLIVRPIWEIQEEYPDFELVVASSGVCCVDI